MAADKIAITLDEAVLSRLEALRRRTKESRSALIARAVRMLLDEETKRDRVREYVAAYRRTPESSAEARAATAASIAGLSALPWDDE